VATRPFRGGHDGSQWRPTKPARWRTALNEASSVEMAGRMRRTVDPGHAVGRTFDLPRTGQAIRRQAVTAGVDSQRTEATKLTMQPQSLSECSVVNPP
jgi:hypothetical protein